MKKYNPKFTFITGALWSVGTRWTIKFAGFLNTVIMARLVLPSDYGIVAMAMLVVEAIHAFTDVGAETAILRIEEPTHRLQSESGKRGTSREVCVYRFGFCRSRGAQGSQDSKS